MSTIPQIVYAAISGDPALSTKLSDQGDALRFYVRGTLGRDGVPALPDTPYVMYGDGAVTAHQEAWETSPNTSATSMVFYVYDDTGSFERIKAVHDDIRRVMVALAGTAHAGGMMVTDVRWLTSGGDMYDQVSRNNVKTLTFRIVGKA